MGTQVRYELVRHAGGRPFLLLHHDDREREFAYESVSGTLKEHEPITRVAERLGWTVISMARDWAKVFPG